MLPLNQAVVSLLLEDFLSLVLLYTVDQEWCRSWYASMIGVVVRLFKMDNWLPVSGYRRYSSGYSPIVVVIKENEQADIC